MNIKKFSELKVGEQFVFAGNVKIFMIGRSCIKANEVSAKVKDNIEVNPNMRVYVQDNKSEDK